MTPNQIEAARSLLYERNAMRLQLRQLAASDMAAVRVSGFEWHAKPDEVAAVTAVVRERLEARVAEFEGALRELGVTDLDEAAVVRS
jgi:hypothetical protein